MNNIAIIILNFNSYADTSMCADRLSSFDAGYHIIITDNSSTDDSYEKLAERYADVSCVDVIKTDRNGGYGYGNNFGMYYAIDKYGADVLGIMNPDVLIPDPDTITRVVGALAQDEKNGIAGGVILDETGNKKLHLSGWNIQTPWQIVHDQFVAFDRFKRRPDMPEIAPGMVQTDCIAGCFFLVRTKCMKEIGFFDENIFMYYEETDIAIRCKKAGYREVIALDAFYYHNHRVADNATISFPDKIRAKHLDYDSGKVILRKHYSETYIPFMWIIECLNRVYLTGCWIRNKIVKRGLHIK